MASRSKMEEAEQKAVEKTKIDRIIFFSDALYAFAITLLVIGIQLPDVQIGSNAELIEALLENMPNLISFVTSFFLIAFFWNMHHTIFGYVIGQGSGLIWLNMLVLFFIVLLPFSSRIFGNYGGFPAATTWYTANMVGVGLTNLLLLRFISNSKRNLSKGLDYKPRRRGLSCFTMAVPVWMVLCWLIGLLTQPGIGDLCLFGLGFVIPFSKKRFVVRYQPAIKKA